MRAHLYERNIDKASPRHVQASYNAWWGLRLLSIICGNEIDIQDDGDILWCSTSFYGINWIKEISLHHQKVILN